MEKTTKIIITISIITILILGILIIVEYKQDQKQFNIKITNDYNIEETEYINNIYFYNIKEIYVNKNETLKDYLKNNTMDNLISKLNITSYLNKEKNLIYKNESLTIIKCNNKKYYIGPNELKIKEGYCNDIAIGDTFKKNYKIIAKYSDKAKNNIYLTLKELNKEEYVTVKTDYTMSKNIKINNNYIFEFRYSSYDTKDNIYSIFENNEVINIKEIKELQINIDIYNK